MKTPARQDERQNQWVHLSEILWVMAWLVIGAVILIGMNISFVSGSEGSMIQERNLWQLLFLTF